MDENIVIFKNEKIGDLIHSVSAIKTIISKHSNAQINVFLSKYNSEMRFLVKGQNVKFHIISEKINFSDKLKVIYFFLSIKISKVYILKPSYFLFLLPIFFYFKKIFFYGICVNNEKYHRPSLYVRKFLKRFVVNDRGTKNIRKSINDLHLNLVLNKNEYKYNLATIEKEKVINTKFKNYFLIHFNKFKFSKLNWELNDFFRIVQELKSFSDQLVLTNDINDEETNILIKNQYNKLNDNKIFYLPNIKGKEFFDVIGNANLVISFHGMITSIAAIQNTNVLDLFNCEINNKFDFYKYKNAFHEFKPKSNNYEFIIPKKDLNRSIHKIKYIIANGRKINNKNF